jgi:hypothetical protein
METQNAKSRFSALSLWLPSRGNVIFTLVVIFAMFWAQSANALPWFAPAYTTTSTNTFPYQGRLADGAGNPITAQTPMIFRLYAAQTGGVPLWEEQWTGPNSVQVSDGLFNVMLGSLVPIDQEVITGHGTLWLGVTAGSDDEMTPRVQLGSVPFAVQALTVPDGSISAAKIADGSVTQAKLGTGVNAIPSDGSVTTTKLADGAVTQAKLGADVSLIPPDGSITTAKLADGAITNQKIHLDFFNSEPFTSELGINTTVQTILTVPVNVPYDSTYLIILNIGTALDRAGDRAMIWIKDNGSGIYVYHVSHSTTGNDGSINNSFIKLAPFTAGTHTITVTVGTVYSTGRVRSADIQIIPFAQFTQSP